MGFIGRNRRKIKDLFRMDTRDAIVKYVPRQYRAWVVIAAGVCLQFSYGGLVYSFGNILPYLVSYLRAHVNKDQTNGSLIWLQSLMSGIPFAMLVGGMIEKRFGPRTGASIGCFMYTTGVFLSYFAIQRSYALLLFTLGFFAHTGQGIAYVNVLTQCQRWVSKENVGFVSGIITSGFASGAFVMAPIESKFVNPDNIPVNPNTGFFDNEELLSRVPKMFLLLSAIFAVIQFIGLLFIAEPAVDEAGFEEASLLALENEENAESSDSQSDEESDDLNLRRSEPINVVIPKKQLLSSSTLLLLSSTLLLNAIWVQTTSGLFKAYGQSFIHDDFFLATTNSFAAAANCVSRILWGIFADKTSYTFAMVFACSLGSILMYAIREFSKPILIETIFTYKNIIGHPVSNSMLFFAWIAAMFTIIGSTYTLIPFGVHKAFGPANFSIAYGCVQICLAFSGFVAAINAQFILPRVGFDTLFILTGVGMACSLILTLCIRRTTYGRNL